MGITKHIDTKHRPIAKNQMATSLPSSLIKQPNAESPTLFPSQQLMLQFIRQPLVRQRLLMLLLLFLFLVLLVEVHVALTAALHCFIS